MAKKEFYVYEHWRPDKNVCFYVGKGKGKRFAFYQRNNRYKNILNKLKRNGLKVEILIINDKLTERQAFALEKKLILNYGRLDLGTGQLANCTDGGEGSAGKLLSEETKKKIGANSRATMSDPKNRKAVAESNRKRVHSKETRRKLSAASKKGWTPERKEKHKRLTELLWKDEGHRKRQSERMRRLNLARWKAKDYRDKMVEVLKACNAKRKGKS